MRRLQAHQATQQQHQPKSHQHFSFTIQHTYLVYEVSDARITLVPIEGLGVLRISLVPISYLTILSHFLLTTQWYILVSFIKLLILMKFLKVLSSLPQGGPPSTLWKNTYSLFFYYFSWSKLNITLKKKGMGCFSFFKKTFKKEKKKKTQFFLIIFIKYKWYKL